MTCTYRNFHLLRRGLQSSTTSRLPRWHDELPITLPEQVCQSKRKKITQAMWTRWWYSGRSLFTANANDSPQNYVLKSLATCSCNVILGYYIFLTKSSCSFKHSRENFVCWKVLQIVNSWQRCVCSWHQKLRASIRQIKMTQQIFVSFDPT